MADKNGAAILKGFDLDEIRKMRARKAASGGVDLVEGINQISPLIGKLGVGDTAKLPVPDGQGLRKFVMSITAKLNNLTPKGGDWEGRTFKVLSDGEGHVYVQRGEDRKGKDIPVRERKGGGPRQKQPEAAASAAAKGETVVV